MFKAFIIGCGRIAGYSVDGLLNNYTHAFAYKNNHNIDLVGCMDTNREKRNYFSQNFNCASYEKLEDGIKKTKCDIVSVCTPDHTHYSIVKLLLEMSSKIKTIFLEKPACSNSFELTELISLSKKNNINIVVNHSRRFDFRYKQIKSNISSGLYGGFINGIITYYSGWKHNGVHIIDTLSYLFNDSIEIIELKIGDKSPYLNDPTLIGLLKSPNLGGEITLMSFDEDYYQIFEFDLRFEKVRLKIEDFGNRILIERKTKNNIGENVLELNKNQILENDTNPIQNAIEIIISSLKNNDQNILRGYRLEDISTTMQTIWNGSEIYDH